MLVISALRQGGGYTVRRLDHLFAISRSTLERWQRYFRKIFPASHGWQRLRGRLLPAIVPQDLPWGLIERFLQPRGDPQISLVACLRALKMPFL